MSEILTKKELSELLHNLNIPVDEGKVSDENEGKYPRILYWSYLEEDCMASGEAYKNLSTYQISFFARIPQHPKYKQLRTMLRRKGIHPKFSHEYIEKDPIFEKTWHTYFSLEVLEDIEDYEEEE